LKRLPFHAECEKVATRRAKENVEANEGLTKLD
jgi:hypothetical protein